MVETIKGNAAQGVQLLDRAVTTFRKENDVPALALALVRRGNAYRFLGNYKHAIQDSDEAEKLSENNDDLQWISADALRSKGIALFRLGQTLQATTYLEQALNIYRRVNDAPSIPLLLMETGMAYSITGDPNRAKDSYEKALVIWRKMGNLTSQASLLNNYGFLYYQLGEYERAVQVFEEGLLCAQRSGYKRMEAFISVGLGDLYSEIEDFDIAAQNYRQINELTQQLGDSFLVHYLAIAEANLALLRKDNTQARHVLDQAEAPIKASNSNYRIRAL